jgi:hypothetical protein
VNLKWSKLIISTTKLRLEFRQRRILGIHVTTPVSSSRPFQFSIALFSRSGVECDSQSLHKSLYDYVYRRTRAFEVNCVRRYVWGSQHPILIRELFNHILHSASDLAVCSTAARSWQAVDAQFISMDNNRHADKSVDFSFPSPNVPLTMMVAEPGELELKHSFRW